MATYNAIIKKRNASNNGWDSVLPITLADNVLFGADSDVKTEIEQIKNNLVSNVYVFGFKGDGVYDNLVAFKNMINYANSVGGNIKFVFPKGDFLIGSAISVPEILVPNVSIVGSGKDITRFILTSGTYFSLNGVDVVKKGFSIKECTIRYSSPDLTYPTILVKKFTEPLFENILYDNGCNFIQMGEINSPSYSLRFNSVSAIVANRGKPFVKLVNGAGFYWTTFDSIFHKESTAPVFNTTSTMNTVEGTNVIDVVGDWDTIDLSIFAEKMYNVINVDDKQGKLILFNVKIYDTVADYIRKSVLNVNLKNISSINTVSFDNVYMSTWEGDAIEINASQSDVRNISINNSNTVFAGKSAFKYVGTSTTLRNLILTGVRFLGTSRVGVYDAVDINYTDGISIDGGVIGGADIYGNIPWGVDSGIKIDANFGFVNITGVVSPSYKILLDGLPVIGNIKKNQLIKNNVFSGTVENNKYFGVKRTDVSPVAPYFKPLTGVKWYNVTPYEMEVIVGGEVTEIYLNDVLLPFTSGSFTLAPSDYYSITYTTANVLYKVLQ